MSTSPIRVLLVDDDVEQYTLIRALLEEAKTANFLVDHAIKAQDCLDTEKSYDIFLIDYRLPDMTGLELAVKLKDNFVRTPVILVTGFTDKRIQAEAHAVGVEDFLEKGILSRELLERTCHYVVKLHNQSNTGSIEVQELMKIASKASGAQLQFASQLEDLRELNTAEHAQMLEKLHKMESSLAVSKQEILTEVSKQLEKGASVAWFLNWIKENPKTFTILVGSLLFVFTTFVVLLNYTDKTLLTAVLSHWGK